MIKRLLAEPDRVFGLFTLAVVFGLTLPTLIQDGMFMDAMLYTSVAHNLSTGFGTFWFPQFSVNGIAGLDAFHEQPPLGFGIMSVFFSILGSSMYVERFYTLLMLIISVLLIVALWKEIYFLDKQLRKKAWLPVFLWITIPVCFWSYSNNMLENTMGIFTLLAVLFQIKSYRRVNLQGYFWVLSGFFIVLATLTKGVPGLFPIVVAFFYWFVTKKISFSKMLLQTVVITAVVVVVYGILMLFESSRESLLVYFNERLLKRVADAPTVESRFHILQRLFMELLPQILLSALILFLAYRKKMALIDNIKLRMALFYIFLGLSASLPLMLTLVQKSFYFVPALPFFAVGLAVLLVEPISAFIERINTKKLSYKFFSVISIILLLGVGIATYLNMGKVGRDKAVLHDVYLITKQIPENELIDIPLDIKQHWNLQCYLMRYGKISVDVGEDKNYLLVSKKHKNAIPEKYIKMDLDTKKYDLYNATNF